MILMLVIILILVLIGMPVSFSLLAGSVYYFASTTTIPDTLLIQRLVMTIGDSYPLLAIPFFMLAGNLMNSGGIATRLFNWANAMVGHIPGGLGHVNVLCSVVFAGMSGSAVADTGGLGPIELKAMKDVGFDDDFSAAITGASSCLGPIIPPSTGMVIYAMMSSTSIARLFIGGIIPGLIMAVIMCIMVYITAKKRKYPVGKKRNMREKLGTFWRALPALMGPAILLGGILLGIFTATESSVVCCVYSIILGFWYKELDFRGLLKELKSTLRSTTMIMTLISFSMIFATILNFEQVPQNIARFLIAKVTSTASLALIIVGITFVSGMFLDVTPAMLIIIPILLPVVSRSGIDLIQFGVTICVLFVLGLMTPPVGSILYMLSDFTGLSVPKISKAVLPYVIVFVILGYIMLLVPGISTFLPNLVLK
jgi:tripartite ATP-independent transporter DctM subunit